MSTEGKPTPTSNAASELATETHHALSAWFMGPKAENSQVMKELLCKIVDRVARARLEYFPEDPVGSRTTNATNAMLNSLLDTRRSSQSLHRTQHHTSAR